MKNAQLSGSWLQMLIAAICMSYLASVASAASISGTIRYEGNKIPKMKPINMRDVEICKAAYDGPALTEEIVIGDDKTFENVFVRVVSGLPDKEYPAPSKPVVLEQRGCRFRPHVIGVQVNQPIRILNSDGLLHNVNAKPKTMRPFNKSMPKDLKEFDHTFTKAEFPFQFRCDVHAWMGAYVGVIEHPFFSVTGKGGTYKISGLDAGTYEIEVWQEFWAQKFGSLKFSVTLADEESKVVDIVYPYGKQAKAGL